MKKQTVKEHALAIAKQVAYGKEARIAYSEVVAKNDLTIGELAALRSEIDSAMQALLRQQNETIKAIAHHCQQHDPKTGHHKPADGSAILAIIWKAA